eukprot:g17409.t1
MARIICLASLPWPSPILADWVPITGIPRHSVHEMGVEKSGDDEWVPIAGHTLWPDAGYNPEATQFEILLKELKRFGDSLSDLSPHQRLIGLGIFELTSNAIVLDAGFEKGMMIVRKSDSMQAQIKDIGQKVVVVTDMSDGRDYNLDVDKLIGGEWKEQAKEKVKEPVKDPDAWKDLMNTAVIKASVIQRLHDALKQRPDQNKDLDMFQKPKGVTATADIAKNKCVLIPLTSKVDVVKQAEAKEPSADDVVPPGDEMGHDEVLEEEREEEVEEEVEDQEEEEEEDTMMKMGINPPPKATHLKLIPKCPPTWKNWNRGAAGHAGKGHPKGRGKARGKARGKGWSAGGKGWSAGPMRPLPPPLLAPLPPPKYPPPGMAAPPMPPPPPPPQPSDSGKQQRKSPGLMWEMRSLRIGEVMGQPLATPSRPRVARVARADGPVGLRSAEHSGELTQRKQRPVIAVLVAMMLSFSLAAAALAPPDPTVEAAWGFVRRNYYDQTFNKQDWNALHERFLRRVDQGERAESVVREMVQSLGDRYRFSAPRWRDVSKDGEMQVTRKGCVASFEVCLLLRSGFRGSKP